MNPQKSDKEATNAAIYDALIEKNNRLKARIKDLEQKLRDTRCISLYTLGPLRSRETILVYVGAEDTQQVETNLTDDFGHDAANLIARHLYYLERSPLTAEVRNAIRNAYIRGGSFSIW
ncbi:hypothetical protein [Alcaligenes faecalis]|uniref:Uncharacterized protein n=1 Tax=Alcaligenes faecalis TaxID=511 RepID=A0A2U2BNM4_ALCFA|nr:hypothetical protein [Alcaligenes faecalis]PWE15621.1 hypothetical protein DF183_02500 [Alcaligenes faecalis]